ncbi:MAG: NACHT domain-containing protein, partial [Bacteroidia bacterium]
ETFLRLNPNVRSIVTSRQTSYIQRPLSSTYFNVFRLAEFDDAQISEYISKWYSSEISNVEKRNVELKLCQSEISDLPIELKSNPLFLSLIVILFRNSVKLPESKLELYESCTRTIVEHWDQDTKNIKFPIDITNKNNVFAHLAFWQYNLLSKKEIKEINHKDVEKVVSEFLMQWTDEREEAQRNAEVFLDFSANRSLYIENKFSHDTFLEYYTALDIFRRLESEGKFEERTKLVSRYINNPRWNIIFELLIPMIDRDVSSNNKLDALFITLLDRPSAQNQIFLLLNVANSITYISPKVKCNLIEKAINFVLDNVQIDVAGYKLSDNFQQVKSVYSAIVPLMNNSRYTIYFQKVFDEIGARIINIERKIKYFIFFFELMFHKNSKEDETVNKIAIALNDKRLLVDGLEKSHHLNLMYLLFEWYYNKNALFIDHLKVYIEKFGYDKLYTYCEFKFIYRVNLITYMNYICWELVFSNSIDTLIRKYANLSIYLKQKAILDNTSWVFLADQDYVHLRKLIMMCDNESLLEFLIALYGNGEKKKRNFEELQKLLDKHTKREFIMKLLK